MKKILLLFCFISMSFAGYSQDDIKDTINTVANQRFFVPEVGGYLVSNALKVDFSAELFDINMRKIRDCNDYVQIPKKEDFEQRVKGGRGANVQFIISEAISDPGQYVIRMNIEAKGETGGTAKGSRQYLVNVKNPTLAAPVSLRESYYFSQNESFSFATAEYSNFNLYSYKITDGSGNTISDGVGPFIRLDNILSDLKYVNQTVNISGYYNGKIFNYVDPASGSVQKSEWSFKLKPQNIEVLHIWTEDQQKAEDFLISPENINALTFNFGYFVRLGNIVSAVLPTITGLRVDSEPSDFVKGQYTQPRGLFNSVILQVNEDFMDAMKLGDSAPVKVTIRFRTQFNENVTKTFYCMIIK